MEQPSVAEKNEIPEGLKEFPPPESLVSLDKQLQTLVDDIKIILESRSKEFHLNQPEKLKIPVIPEQYSFESIKTDRKRYINELLHIDHCDRKKTFSESVLKDFDSVNVERLFSDENLHTTLLDFFKSKIQDLLTENSLLLSRLSRYHKISDIQKYNSVILKRQEELQEWYRDCCTRYERLHLHHTKTKIQQQVLEEQEEMKRAREERDGLAVLKGKQTNETKNTGPSLANQKVSNVIENLGGPDLESVSFTLSDFTIYLRWYITTLYKMQDTQMFFKRVQSIVQTDRAEFLQDYIALDELEPGNAAHSPEYESMNGFIKTIPLNPSKVEDFFTEFENLISWFGIETTIGHEDGRPFAYEVDHKFMNCVYENCTEMTFVPYDTIQDQEANPTAKSNIGGFNGTLGLDSSISTLATIAGINTKLNKSNMPRLKKQTWSAKLKPDFDTWSLRNRQAIEALVETDMELKLDYDVLLLSDHEQIQAFLKDSAKRMWERAAAVPNCRPVSTKVSIIPQLREHKLENDGELRVPKLFDFGFVIPIPFADRIDHILNEKKLAYGTILKTNEDTRKLEIEIMNADPTKQFDKSNYITPTIASIFAEHEVLAYQQLRYSKIRELRSKVLRQLNYFASIEKRITLDLEVAEVSEAAEALADMLEKSEFFDINGKQTTEFSEDFRTTQNDKIYITDRKGVTIVYDSAVQQLEKFDEEMIKLLTAYLNSTRNTDGKIDLSYLDELRFRTSHRKNDIPNVTFRNPDADRMQIMLEYYDMYHDYFYAKVQLINVYMEAFENMTSKSKMREIAQLVTNIIHAKPIFNLEEENFSRSIIQAKHSMLMHSQMVEQVMKQVISRHREFVDRFQQQIMPKDIEATIFSRQEANGVFFSHLKFGLPHVPSETPNIVMHTPGMTFSMTEVIPELETVTKVWSALQQTCDDAYFYISKVLPKGVFHRHIAECITLKIFLRNWDAFSDIQFKVPLPKRGTFLEPDVYFGNPYIADAVLRELYVPFDQTDDGNHKSLEVLFEPINFYNDPGFQKNGIEILYRLLRAILLSCRITTDWLETEIWRKTFDSQLNEIGVKKGNYNARLPSLKFEYTSTGIKDVGGDEEREDDQEGEINEVADGLEYDNERGLKYGPLAIAELDETFCDFEAEGIEGVLLMIKRDGIQRLKHILKIQMIEKYWNMSAAELSNLILLEADIYEIQELNRVADLKTDENSLKKNDLNPLVPTIMNQKKLLRKVMLTEFAKENKILITSDISEMEKDTKVKRLKDSLIDFYCRNMVNVVSQEVERAEFAKFMTDFRTKLDQTNYASLIFALSPITKYSDYLSNLEGQTDIKMVLKQPAATQGLVFADSNGTTDRLAKLWYIPHVTEIIAGMTRHEKYGKQQYDLSWTIFKNPGHFLKSLKVHSLIHDIFHLVAFTSNILQGNARYSASVAAIREADYIVNSMTAIKRDFLVQGENAEFARVNKGLFLRWQFWTMKWKLFLQVCSDCLCYNFLHTDVLQMQHLYEKSVPSKLRKTSKGNRHSKIFSRPKKRMTISTNLLPELHLFLFLSKEGRRLCDFRVSEIEEDLEEVSTSLQSEPKDETKQKLKIEYVSGILRRYSLLKEYAVQMTNPSAIPYVDEETRNIFYMKYKMRIVVPAIRTYHRQGSKGGLSTEVLLRDSNVIGPVSEEFKPIFMEPDFNRMAKTAFDKCIVSALQNELLRQYTLKKVQDAKDYMEGLTDERIGRLFRSSDNIHISSLTGHNEFAFKLSDQDYNIKSELFNEFLSELYEASVEFANSLKVPPKPRKGSQANLINQKPNEEASAVFDDKRIFACKKTDLGNIIVKFATRLNNWKNDRRSDHERFVGALNSHLIEMIRNCEKIISQQTQEKREITKNFDRDVRLTAHELALDAYSAMASMEVELIEAKKNRKVDEKRIRNRILEEYDSLVDELVREIAILRNRFHEYQVSSFNDIMNIISESKKEQLMTMKNDESLTISMRNVISSILKHDEEIDQYRQQNYELKMTVLKIRSMFTMREQGAKSFFQGKVRKLTEFNKETETRLWDSFRDAESRERALRKQLARLQKAKSSLDIQNDMLQRQLQEEVVKPRLNDQQTRIRSGKSTHRDPRKTDTEKLKRHDGVNIENLIQELANKTALVEELLQEKKEKDKNTGKAQTRPSTEQTQRALSAKRPKSPMFYAQAAEPSVHLREQRMQYERIDELENENKALRRKLFLNGIGLPPESKKSLASTSARFDSATPSRSRPRTAISQSSTLRMTPALVDPEKLPAIKRLHSASKQVAFQDLKPLE